MPLFEYECKNCGREFEALILGSERAACPSCQSEDLEKVFSSFAVSQGGSTGRGNSASRGSGHCVPSGGGG